MEIHGKVYLLFEQSGTFKKAFSQLGFVAYDYDIQNNFAQTDFQIDLFAEIEKAFRGDCSIFDGITKDDLVMAFFPCIYFCENNQLYFRGEVITFQQHGLSEVDINKVIIERARNREYFYTTLLKLFSVCTLKNIRLIVENPYSVNHYLINNFPYKAKVIDRNRQLRGDYFRKPTQYWFHNCEPTHGATYTTPNKKLNIRALSGSKQGGICNETRSMISPEYAHNFIIDFVLGKYKKNSQLQLF